MAIKNRNFCLYSPQISHVLKTLQLLLDKVQKRPKKTVSTPKLPSQNLDILKESFKKDLFLIDSVLVCTNFQKKSSPISGIRR